MMRGFIIPTYVFLTSHKMKLPQSVRKLIIFPQIGVIPNVVYLRKTENIFTSFQQESIYLSITNLSFAYLLIFYLFIAYIQRNTIIFLDFKVKSKEHVTL